MATDVPMGLATAFAELNRMQSEFCASMAMQTPIIESMILQAYRAEVAKVLHQSTPVSPEAEAAWVSEAVPFEREVLQEEHQLLLREDGHSGSNDAGGSDLFSSIDVSSGGKISPHFSPDFSPVSSSFESKDLNEGEKLRLSKDGSVKNAPQVSFAECASAATAGNRWKSLVKKLLDLHAGVGRVALRPEWATSMLEDNRKPEIKSLKRGMTVVMGGASAETKKIYAGSTMKNRSYFQKMIFHPDGMAAKFMLVLGSFGLSYDVVSVPYLLCFGAEESWLRMLDCGLTIFWTCDMCFCSLMGYHAGHIVEMRPLRVFQHYMQTWGLLDFTIVASDWVGVVFLLHQQSGHSSNWVSTGRALKYYRFLRILRMLRLVKIIQSLSIYVEGFATEVTLVMGKLLGILVFIFLINHYIACAWYALAYYNSTDDMTWSKALHLDQSPKNYLYVVALHWTLTQFTPATNNVNPMNLRERIFAFFVVLFALIIFSSFLGSLTSAMSQLKQIHLDRYSEETRIRKFIFERQVSLQCARSIWDFYRTYAKAPVHSICMNDFPFLKKLPRMIRMALHEDITMPIVTTHHAFWYFNHFSHDSSILVCEAALTEIGMHAEQEIFNTGVKAESMLILNIGSVRYDSDVYDDVESLNSPQFISEVAVWGTWLHSGTLNTISACHALSLNAKSFGTVVRSNCDQGVFGCLRAYAGDFIKHVNRYGDDGVVVTDIVRSEEAESFKVSCQRLAQQAFVPLVKERSSQSSETAWPNILPGRFGSVFSRMSRRLVDD